MKQRHLTPVKQIKANNIKRVMQMLLRYGSCTKPELVQYTGLPNSTISECINSLHRLRYVQSCGQEQSMGGRRPQIYEIREDYGALIGIMVGRGRIHAGLMNYGGQCVQSYTRDVHDVRPVIHQIYDVIETIREQHNQWNITAIGLGLDGTLDTTQGIIHHNEALQWRNVHIRELLERRFLIHTYLDHRINNHLIYQRHQGYAVACENFVIADERCTEKVALYIDGHLLRGKKNMAGLGSATPNDLLHMKHFLDLEAVFWIGNLTEKVDGVYTIVPSDDDEWMAAAMMAHINSLHMIYYALDKEGKTS